MRCHRMFGAVALLTVACGGKTVAPESTSGVDGTDVYGGNGKKGVPAGGRCDPRFCPSISPLGTPCCVGNACGVDYGVGCSAVQTCVTVSDCDSIEAWCTQCQDGTNACPTPVCQLGHCLPSSGDPCDTKVQPVWYLACPTVLCSRDIVPTGARPCVGLEQAQQWCYTVGDVCDPSNTCGANLVCSTSDPRADGTCRRP